MLWTGGCLCGKRRYEVEADIKAVGICHCNMCKKATGGTFALLMRVPESAFRWTAAPPAIYRSSRLARRGFCPECGSPLYLDYDDDEYIRITAGSVDQVDRIPPPTSHYGIESRVSWVDCWSDLPGEPSQEQL